MKKYSEVFKKESSYKVYLLSLLALGVSGGIFKGISDNYFAEIVGMMEFQRGLAEFFRELPGFLLVASLALLYSFSAEGIFKLGAGIMIMGMALFAIVPPSLAFVTMALFIYSYGEHLTLAMRNSLGLEYSKEGKGGQALGAQTSVYSIGTLAGFIIVIVFASFMTGRSFFRTFFISASFIIFAAFLLALKMNGNIAADSTKKRFYFKKKFTKYYMLEIFYGSRKQVFFTFGPYVLILMYGASTFLISVLFAISAICEYFMSPLVGKIIDRIGFKKVMVMDTLILVIVCFFYGFAHHIFPRNVAFVICCINYIFDSIISLASMASNVYVQSISDSKEEMRATISTGMSVNHFITILIALFGGWLWMKLGVEYLFILSAFLGLCNSAYAATIKTEKK